MTKRIVVLLALVLSAACNDSPTTPTPTPTPTAVPPSLFTLSGTVTETWPTTTTPVAGATISITAGRDIGFSAVTDASGRYTITGLQLGPMTVKASATGYEDATQTLTLSADRPGFAFEVNPSAAMVDERFDDTVTATNTICDGFDSTTRLPCRKYLIALHAEGRVESVLTWDDRLEMASALALEVVRETATGPQQIGVSRVTEGNPNREEVIATLPAGLYSVRVLYQRDLGPQVFVLTVRHPK